MQVTLEQTLTIHSAEISGREDELAGVGVGNPCVHFVPYFTRTSMLRVVGAYLALALDGAGILPYAGSSVDIGDHTGGRPFDHEAGDGNTGIAAALAGHDDTTDRFNAYTLWSFGDLPSEFWVDFQETFPDVGPLTAPMAELIVRCVEAHVFERIL